MRYRTILADPPWDVPNQRGGRGVTRHYPLMPLDAIRALRVDQLAAPDAHLWLWATNGDWHRQITVLEAWGFTYKSCLTWVKPYFRLGQYLRNQTEHLLFGVRGRAPIQFRGQPSCFYAPVQEHSHSRKEAFCIIIERCSPGPYLELFARRKRPGWHSWGDQVTCDVAL